MAPTAPFGRTSAIPAWRARLSLPISAQSLAVVRVLFGAILLWDCYRYVSADRIRRYYVDVEMTFPYFGLDFIQPLPEPLIHWVWWLVGLSSFLVMIGLFYRVAIVTFILTFGYFFLLDRTQYLNHNYMVLLYACLLALAPAHRMWSVDARLRPALASRMIPCWPVAAIRLQTEIILIYAGIVKITDDWLRGEPLRMWTNDAIGRVWIAPIFQWDWVVMAAAIGTIVLHVFGAPLLMWRRTRIWIFLIYCAFHVSNSIFFNIGIFPWLTIAVTTIFFAPNWPELIAVRLFGGQVAAVSPLRQALGFARISVALLALLALWFAVQLALPMRQVLFPTAVGWTGDGHRFSWRMRIYDRRAKGSFIVETADGRGNWTVDPDDYLTDRQAEAVLTRPDLIHAFARRIDALWQQDGHGDVIVRAQIEKSLNGRPWQIYVDPSVDLSAVPFNWFAPDPWVLPARHRAAEDRFPAWWPPLADESVPPGT
jgi:hypothetical protein